jgi:hypothetical protein
LISVSKDRTTLSSQDKEEFDKECKKKHSKLKDIEVLGEIGVNPEQVFRGEVEEVQDKLRFLRITLDKYKLEQGSPQYKFLTRCLKALQTTSGCRELEIAESWVVSDLEVQLIKELDQNEVDTGVLWKGVWEDKGNVMVRVWNFMDNNINTSVSQIVMIASPLIPRQIQVFKEFVATSISLSKDPQPHCRIQKFLGAHISTTKPLLLLKSDNLLEYNLIGYLKNYKVSFEWKLDIVNHFSVCYVGSD